jgi:anti-sigma B factor antagonist
MTSPPADTTGRRTPAVVTLPAEVDMANAEAAENELTAALAGQPGALIIDMTHTIYCDSAGVRAVMLTCKRAAEAGCDVRLVITSPTVLRIFTLMGADQHAAIHPDLNSASAPSPGQPDQPGRTA